MTPISQIQPVSTFEFHNGISILVTPIINNGRQTGTRFGFVIGEFRRQAFSLEAAKAMINEIQGLPAPAPNPLVEVATQAKRQRALRGGIGDPKSETPFG